MDWNKPNKIKTILNKDFRWSDLEDINKSLDGFDVGIEFKNGHWASVILQPLFNINYEVLSCVTSNYSGYVKQYQSKRQIMSHLKYISKLNKKEI